MKIIQNLAGKRLDPEPVAALMAVYERGEIRIQRSIASKGRWLPDAGRERPAAAAPALPTAEAANLERTRV